MKWRMMKGRKDTMTQEVAQGDVEWIRIVAVKVRWNRSCSSSLYFICNAGLLFLINYQSSLKSFWQMQASLLANQNEHHKRLWSHFIYFTFYRRLPKSSSSFTSPDEMKNTPRDQVLAWSDRVNIDYDDSDIWILYSDGSDGFFLGQNPTTELEFVNYYDSSK